ncbi:MAG TPA: asparagine synthase (glutamine-hydrolyzing) [Planctomycetota bacterium]|nr:asparagine synthase (glutamine-hydrolyzing) [Planctomycetota bacterium]
MCGLAGFLQAAPGDRSPLHEAVASMADVLRHRGPDAGGLHADGPCTLAHRRLSIIDLSAAGHQPMSSADGDVWISYNGEVYNFRELRERHGLDRAGCRFRSRTDTEVLIYLYQQLGIGFLKELNGMFALALWDRRSRTLHLARDGYGIKPLFHLRTRDGLWFASEIKALLGVPGFSPRPSVEALHHYLSFAYVPGSLTAFEDVRELRPGHVMSVRAGGEPEVSRFHRLRYPVDRSMRERDAVERTRDLLRRAVERHLIADVPVGVMLSGGIDSSALSATMASLVGTPFHTFALAFDDRSFDESSYAGLVAKRIGSVHHEIRVTPNAVRDLLPKYLCSIDEPYADGSAIPTYLLAREAKRHVVVLLSGEGGDEFFSGYDTHAAFKARRLWRRVPGFARRLASRAVRALPVSHEKLSFEFKAKRFVRGAELDVPRSHHFWRVVLDEDAKREVLHATPPSGALASADLFAEAFAECDAEDELNRLLYVDAQYHLPDDLMIKNDRMTMAHSIEARVPFTDLELVEFLGTVPPDLKMKGMRRKHLLKEAMRGVLPPEVLTKKKVGLEMPYSRWLCDELRDVAEHAFARSRVDATGMLNGAAVERLMAEHQARKVDHGRALWSLLNWMLWHETYVVRKDFASYLDAPRAPRDQTAPVPAAAAAS